jgi:hypothetical protein
MYLALHGMETSLMSHFGRKVAIAAAVFATVGSTVFGGAALASPGRGGVDIDGTGTGGAGGAGGSRNIQNCPAVLNDVVDIPIGILGVGVTGDNTQVCAQDNSGGAGGAGTGIGG